jgi:hypothetical protein
MKTKIAFLVNFVRRHKVAIAVGMTATAFVLIIMRNQKELNKFLEAHGLMDEFYALED